MAKSRLPKRIKIGAHNYEVKCYDNLGGPPSKKSIKKLAAIGKHAFHYGEVQLDQCLIKLNRKMSWYYWQIVILEIWFQIFVEEKNIDDVFEV